MRLARKQYSGKGETMKQLIEENYQVVSPAYDRDYKSAKDAKADFLAGKGFKFESMSQMGQYCSMRDFKPGVVVEVRYAKLTKATMVEVMV